MWIKYKRVLMFISKIERMSRYFSNLVTWEIDIYEDRKDENVNHNAARLKVKENMTSTC